MNLLFITSNRLGDAVLGSGVLARLIERHPGAHITIAVGPHAAPLFRAVPGLRQLFVLEKKSWNRHWLLFWQACHAVRWDIVVDLRNSLPARLLFARQRYYLRRLPGRHKVIENAAAIGEAEAPPAPHIWLDAEAEDAARKIMPAGKPVLALAPVANWPPKEWLLARFTELVRRLIASGGPLAGAAVLILAGAKERAAITPLLQAIPDAQRIELLGHDLLTVTACLKRARLFIGNDSGLMHLSAAAGAPTLALFGPALEDIYGPWGKNCAVVRTPETAEELLARMPNMHAREPNLMEGLSVDSVFNAARKLLDATKS